MYETRKIYQPEKKAFTHLLRVRKVSNGSRPCWLAFATWAVNEAV